MSCYQCAQASHIPRGATPREGLHHLHPTGLCRKNRVVLTSMCFCLARDHCDSYKVTNFARGPQSCVSRPVGGLAAECTLASAQPQTIPTRSLCCCQLYGDGKRGPPRCASATNVWFCVVPEPRDRRVLKRPSDIMMAAAADNDWPPRSVKITFSSLFFPYRPEADQRQVGGDRCTHEIFP